MAARGKYKTRQRELVAACLVADSNRYLTVDAVWSLLDARGERVGRSTVYRALESMAQEGEALKATAPGGEASYRMNAGTPAGQLVCLSCGRALPLDCHMVVEFSEHVREHHGFAIEPSRTVLYGLCSNCEAMRREQ